MGESGSLVKTIMQKNNLRRSLKPLSEEELREETTLNMDPSLDDTEQPVDPDRLNDEFVPEELYTSGVLRLTHITFVILLMGSIAAAWRWTSLADLLNVSNLVHLANTLKDHPVSPVIVLGAYGIGGLIVFPLSVLIGATALVFPPVTAMLYSLTGSLFNGVILYGIGHFIGRRGARRIAGKRLNRISRILSKRGILAVFMVRILPVAPYSIVNVVAGASHIRFRDYCIGTAAGITPGIVLLSFFAVQVRAILEDPRLISWLVVLALMIMGTGLIVGLQRFVKKRLEKKGPV
jgi:uncharacterized membrane protein YdjX (TVP38/TMEM64 family)